VYIDEEDYYREKKLKWKCRLIDLVNMLKSLVKGHTV